jgi:mRNA-degrading endonuclease toxin of MazEF toxin-antitoxin module
MRSAEALALVICAALMVACSSQSQNTKPAVVVARAPAAASAATAATAGAADPEVDPALIKEGYRVVRRQGKILYCQTQTVTGTKFGNTVCRTAEQIQEEKRDTELSKRMLIRSGPANCVGTQCSN